MRAGEDVAAVAGGPARRGVLRAVAGAPLALVRGAASLAAGGLGAAAGTPRSPAGAGEDGSLATQWIGFLIEQARPLPCARMSGLRGPGPGACACRCCWAGARHALAQARGLA